MSIPSPSSGPHTSRFYHVMTRVAARFGLTLSNHYGMVDEIDPEPDIVLLPHSLFQRPPTRPYRAIRSIRDPRDIWVSGYLFHLRCDELWCVTTDLSAAPPIGLPSVDYSILHCPEVEKRAWLARLNGVSYQQNLRDRSIEDGCFSNLAAIPETHWTRCEPGVPRASPRWTCGWKTPWQISTARCDAFSTISGSLRRLSKPRSTSRGSRMCDS
jgi:hypothetical protein